MWPVGWPAALVLATVAAMTATLFLYQGFGKTSAPPKESGHAGLPQTQLSILVLPFAN
jgi:hypothetical protein